MKIGIISDTHIPESAICLPENVFKVFNDVELILHAGDLTEVNVLDTLKSIAPVKAVFGNMDSSKIKSLLPSQELITLNNFKIGLIHGWGAPKNLIDLLQKYLKNNKVDIIVFGHSHTPLCEYVNGIFMLNPGSPTDKVFAPYNSVGILELSDKIKGKIIRI